MTKKELLKRISDLRSAFDKELNALVGLVGISLDKLYREVKGGEKKK